MNEEEDDSSFHSCSSGNNGVGSLAMHDNAEVNWNPTTLLVLNDITFDTVFANIVGICLVNGIIRIIITLLLPLYYYLWVHQHQIQ